MRPERRVMVACARESLAREPESRQAPHGRALLGAPHERLHIALDAVPRTVSDARAEATLREALRLWTDRGYTPEEAAERLGGAPPSEEK